MSPLTRLSDRFLQAAEVEAQTPITAGLRPRQSLALPAAQPTTALMALAKLVELRRRALGLAPLELAQRASVSHLDLLHLEEGVVGLRVLEQLPAIARELQLRESPLLELAGIKADLSGKLRQAAQTFVGRVLGLADRAAGEAEALAEFVRVLDSD